MIRHHSALSRQQGMGMIEVMLSIVIIAIGVLGLAGIQAAALKHTNTSYARDQAMRLAYDLADRIRAYDAQQGQASVFATVSGTTLLTPTVTAACYQTSGCTRAQMAQSEVASWLADVRRLLPRGEALICLDDNNTDEGATVINTASDGATYSGTNHRCSNTGPTYVIKIWWADDRSGRLTRYNLAY
ncbi:type IV pilus modification protein PilV [Chitinimonas lacunae]|uniref:Type IV pilus modification protein PilV n=1 Tax=Chitinimonas lacunae TaxID=1963018 RepID=A0ABV8MT31_9NEIS